MNQSNKLLSEIVAYRTYSKFLPHLGRRESLEESINRAMYMHLDKFPKLSRDIVKAFQKVHELKIMPSMRSLQFAGDAVLKNNARGYNCSALHIDDPRSFGETLFLLLSGVGVGFSVQKQHIHKLPVIQQPRQEGYFVIQDSIAGWSQALDTLVDAYFLCRIKPNFDFGQISPKGTYLATTGAKAPGPDALQVMLREVESKFKLAIGRKLSSIEIHDIICIISDCVLSGGIRRSSLVSLFDKDDESMLKAKQGEWWVKYPYRARANNSAVLDRATTSFEEFSHVYDMCHKSNSGEPGFKWSNNTNLLANPCVIGETEILTKGGYQRIDSLVDQETDIWNGFEWSKVVPKITGINQKILTVSLSDGRSLNCTPYHKFHIAKGYTGTSEIIEACNLESGMKLIKHDFPLIEGGEEYEHAYTQGFISAEGMDDYNHFSIYDPKKMCIPRLTGGEIGKWEELNKRTNFKVKYNKLSKNFVPFTWSVKSKLDWLSGLFDGDGTELKEGGLQLVSIERKFLANLQKLLSTLGIQSKVTLAAKAGLRSMPDGRGGMRLFACKESHRILVGAVQMQQLKKIGLSCERMSFQKTPQRDASQFVTVVDVSENGEAEIVYCFNEPLRNLGIFDGIITGQCLEISLNSNQFCNLTSINQTGIESKKDFLSRIYSATLIGTLQAAYTDFPYLRPQWKHTTETEALLGVSFTGIADNAHVVTSEWLQEGAAYALEVNERYAKKLGINVAARLGAIKPEGSASTVLGSSSGIHDRHSNEYYLRRIRMNKNDNLAHYLSKIVPHLIEEDVTSAETVVLTVPQESPRGCIGREDSNALSLFDRTMMYNNNWISNTHRSGDNKNNVSVTLSVREEEWEPLKQKMWDHRNEYTGISLLPYDNSSYKQMPFETCDKETFDKYNEMVKEIDLKLVKEEHDSTDKLNQSACIGGLCEANL